MRNERLQSIEDTAIGLLGDRVRELRNKVAEGSLDRGAYRARCGEIEGLRFAMRLLDELKDPGPGGDHVRIRIEDDRA